MPVLQWFRGAWPHRVQNLSHTFSHTFLHRNQHIPLQPKLDRIISTVSQGSDPWLTLGQLFGCMVGAGQQFHRSGRCQMLGAIPLAIQRFCLASNSGIVQIAARCWGLLDGCRCGMLFAIELDGCCFAFTTVPRFGHGMALPACMDAAKNVCGDWGCNCRFCQYKGRQPKRQNKNRNPHF